VQVTILHITMVAVAAFTHVAFAIAFRRCFSRPDGGTPLAARAVAVVGGASQVLHLTGLVVAPASTVTQVPALLCYLAAVLLFWRAQAAIRGQRLPIAFSAGGPPALVVTGPYRVIRNPIYVSYSLAWLAGGLAITWLFAWLPVVVMGLLYTAAARGEEKAHLTGPLGRAYRAYRNRTPAWLPFG